MSADCLFCKIIAGDIPAEIVSESEHTIAFKDINPEAPTHVLVIPRRHEPDIGSLAEARAVAESAGNGSYRLVFNTGADAAQTVFHCHGHVLAGRSMSWPPG